MERRSREANSLMTHSRMYEDSDPALRRLRKICLGFPEVVEKEAWGECTFRVRDKMFAMTDYHHHGADHVAVWIKAPEMVQEILVKSDPARFFRPPYVGHKGWVGVRLDGGLNWDELAAILKDGYLMSAPSRVAAKPRKRTDARRAWPVESITPRRRSRNPRL
jgi:hypothetical protein